MTTATKSAVARATAGNIPEAAALSSGLDSRESARPLSFAQERLWFLDQLEPNKALYHIATLARLEGPLQLEFLARSLDSIVTRHEVLRSRIVCLNEAPAQEIAPASSSALQTVDLANLAEPERERELERLVGKEVNRPMQLSGEPLVRLLLIKLRPEDHRLLVVLHHIIADESSVKLFFRELAEFYQAYVEGRSPSVPELQLQYPDYAAGQRTWLRSSATADQLRYWKQQLDGFTSHTELPADHPRGLKQSFKGAVVTRRFNPGLTEALHKVAREEKVTPFMLLLAGFNALLFRYTRQEDLAVGSPISGRNQVETEDLIGMFVNTVVLRSRVHSGLTFRELLKSVRQTVLGAYANQELPFEKVVEALHPDRSLHHLPFTRIMFLVQPDCLEDFSMGGVHVSFSEPENGTAKFELTLSVQQRRDALVARAEYNTDLFERATVERLLEHLEVLLTGAAAQPGARLAQLPLLSAAERERLLVDWNRTTAPYPRDKCVHEIFQAQVERTPEAPAVIFSEETLTYRELNARANQLAHYLRKLGVGSDTPVAICIERSTDMAVGLLAILKAGGAYVPLDPTYPQERLSFMLKDSGAKVLLTQQRLLRFLPQPQGKVVCIDADWELIDREPGRDLPNLGGTESLAYIMYTSGSTGLPKGVAVPHRAINRLVLNTDYIRLDASDRIAQVSNISFDATTFEIWGALLNGARLICITTDIALSPRDFARELREHRITAIFLTAALFNQLAADAPGALASVRTVIAGGEPLDPKWTRSVLQHNPPGRLLNGYGPTEGTTFSCCYLIHDVPEGASNVPIGRPIANTAVYLLDPDLNPVPVGVTGELYLGGDGLARGYWNRPELTAAKFIPNPFPQASSSARLYKTGDLARYRPDGTIEFLGRADGQVKLRGFRVELGEIETVLREHEAVQECAVLATDNGTGLKKLVAYYVSGASVPPSPNLLRKFLAEKLPNYMLPAAFVRLPALPLTANGKVDRKALPEPGIERPELEKKFVPPAGDIETKVARIWEDALAVHPIGAEDNFFDLGGHSLLSVRVMAQIEKVFGKKLRLAAIFQAPTVRQLAVLLREEGGGPASSAGNSLVEIQPNGTRRPLFLVHGAGGGMFWGYANLARHLGNDQPLYGFRSRGLDGHEEFGSLEEMAAQYVKDLRSVQPFGPYQLGGYCFGGNVAYEMARQLSGQGESVSLLALMNCTPPNSRYGRPTWTVFWFGRFLRNLWYWLNYFIQWTPTQRRKFFRWKFEMTRKNLAALNPLLTGEFARLKVENLVDLSSFSAEQQKLWETHIRAQFAYHPRPYAGRVHLIRSPGHPLWCSYDPKYGWGHLARRGLEVCIVPGVHEKILEEPCVQVVATQLKQLLSREHAPQRRTLPETSNTRLPLRRRSSADLRSLSFVQRRLWFLNQLETGVSVYHQAKALRLRGQLNRSMLESALELLFERHETLRTNFPAEQGQPVARLCSSSAFRLEHVDLSRAPASQQESQIRDVVRERRVRPFDLAAELPFRAALIHLGPAEHVLLLIWHEIATDACSAEGILRELLAIYQALRTPSSSSLSEVPFQYADFAVWQNQQAKDGFWSKALLHYKEQLATAPALIEFPTDFSRPAVQSYRGQSREVVLSVELLEKLRSLADERGASVFTLLLASVNALLQRYVRQEQSVIATTVSARDFLQDGPAVGNFETLLLFRTEFPGEVSFLEFLDQQRKVVSENLARKALPFELLLQELRPVRDQSYHPLAQVLFGAEKSENPQTIGELEMTPLVLEVESTRFDLTFRYEESPAGLRLRVEYATDLFRTETIGRLLGHWQTLLEGIAADPQKPAAQLPMLTSEESRVLAQWTETQRPYAADKTLVDLFAEQVRRTPDAAALVSGTRRLTYAELEQYANAVASRLRRLGVAPQELVALCLERTWEMVACMLGILRAGAAYVPMDPAYPRERIAFMMSDANICVLITQQKLLQALPATDAQVLCVEEFDWRAADTDVIRVAPTASDLAYIIYTSGSTGQPKGVALEHRNAAAFVQWAREVFTTEELNGVMASTSICFDLSIFEIFVPLCCGGKVILAENALSLANSPAANEVRLINTVPSVIRELLRAKAVPPSVQVINLAGEPLPTSLVDQIYSQTAARKVFDLYGPTETTTYSTYTLRRPGEPASIGRPLANEYVLLLDAHRQLVPIGVPGELYIGGVGVTRGYLHRPELTAERFVTDPLRPGARLYKTGDLARWRSDGNLEYLGRIDHQIKIRGFRVELGEIESHLKKQSGVNDAVVVAREDTPGAKRLVAYLDVGTGERPSMADLKSALRSALPEYMLPDGFVFLEALPLTPNGKVDRKALPKPEAPATASTQATEMPANVTQEQLASIWREVLHLDQIGIHQNFFDLGGHSLLGFQVISRIREAFKVELPLSSLFDAPTIALLAEGLDSHRWLSGGPAAPALQPSPRAGDMPASFVQERLWFLDQLVPGNHAYNIPFALRLRGCLNIEALERAFSEMVQRHEILRTTFCSADGNVRQVIHPSSKLQIRHVQFEPTTGEALSSEAEELLRSEAQQPFDLARGPLMRVLLGRLAQTDHILLITMHHTISDGWSLAVFLRELDQLYQAFRADKPTRLPEVSLQYADFAAWQQQWLRGQTLERELDYWKQALQGAPAKVALPLDCAAPAQSSVKAQRRARQFDSGLTKALQRTVHETGTTPFILLLSALTLTLQKWSSQRDLVIGTVTAGRQRREIENALGCFMNFLPVRVRISGQETGEQLVSQVKERVLGAQAHQDCPFEKIVEVLNPERKLNQNPLYNVALLLQNFPAQTFQPPGLEATPVPVALEAPLLDLRFEAEQTERGFSFTCEYNADLFASETIDHLLASFEQILQCLLEKPGQNIDEFKLTDALEAQILRVRQPAATQTIAVCATFTAEPVEEALRYWMKQLEAQVEIQFAPYNQLFQQLLNPASLLGTNSRGLNVVLVRLEDWRGTPQSDSGSVLAFDNVERNASEFLAALKTAVARPSTPWLICFCPPSPALFAADEQAGRLLSLEKNLAGELEKLTGVYVVESTELSRVYPVREYHDPRAEALGHVPYTPAFFTALGTMIARKFHALNHPVYKVIVLDCDQTLWSGVCGEDGPEGIRLDEGRRALQEFMRSQQAAGRLLCLCSKNNEDDVEQVFSKRPDMPLQRTHFAACRLNWQPKPENLRSLAKELGLGLDAFVFIDDNPVECAAVEAECPEVLALQLPTKSEDISRFLSHCWAFDQLKITAEDRTRAETYRHNQQREQLRASSAGLKEFLNGLELKIQIEPLSSAQLARAAQLTQRTNQFNFTSRRRVESELQALLRRAEALTVTVSDRFGDYGLVGLAIFQQRAAALELETFLLSCRVLGRGVEHRLLARLGRLAQERRLSWLDVHFVRSPKNKPALDFLEKIGGPYRQALNGGYVFKFPAGVAASVEFKIDGSEAQPDTEAAPAPVATTRPRFNRYPALAREAVDVLEIHRAVESQALRTGAKPNGYVAPRTDFERKLCELWQKLLRVDRVGIQDNFFELGGHSLLAVRLFAELEKLSQRKLPLVTLFQAPTVEQLVRLLRQDAGSHPLLVPIQPNGARPPLYLVHGAGGDVLWGYANLAAHLPAEQPVYGIKSRGQAGLEELTSVEEMAACYIEQVRAFQPSGPYCLGGYCFGGNVAYEMARQFQAQGQEVALVALLDSAPANAGYETLTWWRPDFSYRFAANLGYWLADFSALKPRAQLRFFGRKTRALGRKLAHRWSRSAGQVAVDLEDVIDPGLFPEHELRLWRFHLRALTEHIQRPYAGPVVLLRTRGQPLFCALTEDFCWSRLVSGGVRVRRVPGSHENVFIEPNVQSLARELAEALAEAQLLKEPK